MGQYRRAPGALERAGHAAGHAILNNFFVEAALVFLISVLYICAQGADRIFGTGIRRRLLNWMQAASRDRLNFLRKAQIRHVFKKKYGMKKIKIRPAGGSYWISIPCIVKGVCKKTRTERKFLAKVMNERSALKHKYMTLFRNIGVIAEGVDIRFDDYHCGLEMGEYEQNCLEKLRNASVNAPKVYGLHKLGGGDYMLVMEFIEGKPVSKVEMSGDMMDKLFVILKKMRENGILHGDVKLDNFMLSNGRVYVFDCLNIGRSGIEEAAAFDLACLLCALSDRRPPADVISRARRFYSTYDLNRAAGMVDMALYKADLNLSEERKKDLKESLSALTRG
jgi:tRNA A-37 threonylcarbamoyl transferase component Bud32